MSTVHPGAGVSLPANYKWIVLSNTTIGMLLATINGSILLIALPDIFRVIARATRSMRFAAADRSGDGATR